MFSPPCPESVPSIVGLPVLSSTAPVAQDRTLRTLFSLPHLPYVQSSPVGFFIYMTTFFFFFFTNYFYHWSQAPSFLAWIWATVFYLGFPLSSCLRVKAKVLTMTYKALCTWPHFVTSLMPLLLAHFTAALPLLDHILPASTVQTLHWLFPLPRVSVLISAWLILSPPSSLFNEAYPS